MSTPAFMKMSSESQSELQLQLQLESPSNSSTSTLASDFSASSSTETSTSDSDSSSIATMYDIPEDAPLPPTSNNLNREERLRLLRSTRKLEALLGTTPMVIDTELSESDYVAPLVSPRTKSRRREGRIFPGRAASPASTLDSADEDEGDQDEEEYFVVPQGVQAADYQHVVGPGEQAPYSFSSSGTTAARRGPLASVDTMTFAQASNLSVNTTASRKRKARGPLPAALVFDNSGSAGLAGGKKAQLQSRSAAAAPSRFGGGAKHSTGSNLNPSNRAQPQPSLFLRLRPAFGRSIKNPPQAAKSPYYTPPTPAAPLSPPIIQSRPPLSPSMATFANSNLSQASLASSHYSTASKGYFDVDTKSSYNQKYDDLDLMDTSPDGRRALTERERRKKMAKLARTLGENVPPELVFRPPPPTRRTSGAYASAAFGYGVQSYPKPPPPPPVVPGMPKLAVADVPPPPPVPVSAPVSVPSSSRAPAPPAQAPVIAPSTSTSGASSSSRKSRPRSLTISPSSSTDTTRGTTSMDAPASPAMIPPNANAHRQTKSLGRAKSVKAALAVEQAKPFTGYAQDGAEGMSISRSASTKRVAALSGEGGTDGFGRRKEREWSGEWNLKDMNDVAARLRGLKA